jgi:L-malate glycosyltransferase
MRFRSGKPQTVSCISSGVTTCSASTQNDSIGQIFRANGVNATPTLLLVGNHRGSHPTALPAVCTTLARLFGDRGFTVRKASSFDARPLRLAHMTLAAARGNFDIAVVEVYSGTSFVWAETTSLAARARGRRVVLALHGGSLAEWSRGKEGRVRRLFDAANAIVTPSRSLARWVATLGARATVIENPIELERFSRVERRPMKEPVVLWMRALHPIYDPETALRAFARVHERRRSARLVLAGPDRGLGESLRRMARELGVERSVEMPGKIPPERVPEVLAGASVFLNTTTAESFGLAVMEAAAAGVPIVSSPAGELAERWTDARDSLIAPIGDVAAFASAMERVLTEPDLAERLTHEAKRRAESCVFAELLPRWIDVFERTLA